MLFIAQQIRGRIINCKRYYVLFLWLSKRFSKPLYLIIEFSLTTQKMRGWDGDEGVKMNVLKKKKKQEKVGKMKAA